MEERRAAGRPRPGRRRAHRDAADLPPFTLIGATTREGLLTTPLRDRFGVAHRLEHYDAGDLGQIIDRSAGILGIEIEPRAASARSPSAPVARRGWPTACSSASATSPRSAGAGAIDRGCRHRGARHARGRHRRASTAATAPCSRRSRSKFAGGPVGLSTLAAAIDEEQDTIEDVSSPTCSSRGSSSGPPAAASLTQRALRAPRRRGPRTGREPVLSAAAQRTLAQRYSMLGPHP